MDQKILSQAKKIIEEKHALAIEKFEQAKLSLMQNQEYSKIVAEIKLNTLSISKALSNNENIAVYEEKIAKLNKKLSDFESQYLNIKNFVYCDQCNDTGVYNERLCDCILNEYRQIIRNNSIKYNLSFEFKDNNILNIPCKQSVQLNKLYNETEEYCKIFPKNRYKNFLICGKVGVGKTCLLSAIYNGLINNNSNALFITVNDLNLKFLSYHTSKIKDKQYVLNNLINAEVLIIDDLGIEPINKNVTLEYLIVLLTEREHKATFFATNLTLTEIQDKYGDRIFSRLTNKDTTKLVYIDGDDLRHINKN